MSKVTNGISKGGARSRKLAIMIEAMPPIVWHRMFFCHNLHHYPDGQLIIEQKVNNNGNNTYSTKPDNANLPKGFLITKFGKDGKTSQQGNGREYDCYNSDMSHEDGYGTYKFESDIASRTGTPFTWVTLNPTNDTFPV